MADVFAGNSGPAWANVGDTGVYGFLKTYIPSLAYTGGTDVFMGYLNVHFNVYWRKLKVTPDA